MNLEEFRDHEFAGIGLRGPAVGRKMLGGGGLSVPKTRVDAYNLSRLRKGGTKRAEQDFHIDESKGGGGRGDFPTYSDEMRQRRKDVASGLRTNPYHAPDLTTGREPDVDLKLKNKTSEFRDHEFAKNQDDPFGFKRAIRTDMPKNMSLEKLRKINEALSRGEERLRKPSGPGKGGDKASEFGEPMRNFSDESFLLFFANEYPEAFQEVASQFGGYEFGHGKAGSEEREEHARRTAQIAGASGGETIGESRGQTRIQAARDPAIHGPAGERGKAGTTDPEEARSGATYHSRRLRKGSPGGHGVSATYSKWSPELTGTSKKEGGTVLTGGRRSGHQIRAGRTMGGINPSGDASSLAKPSLLRRAKSGLKRLGRGAKKTLGLQEFKARRKVAVGKKMMQFVNFQAGIANGGEKELYARMKAAGLKKDIPPSVVEKFSQ